MAEADQQHDHAVAGAWPPQLFSEQPAIKQIASLLVGPIAFGAVCGWLLGVSEVAYTVLTLLAIGGGIAAGYEHTSLKSGALRGFVIGIVFSLTICETHRLLGVDSKANTPDPIEEIVVVFAAISAVLGMVGAALRVKRERAQA